jgi:predicted nucleic acid-binding protein
MTTLKNIPELNDKIIVATAKHLNLPIITKDETLQNIKKHLVIKNQSSGLIRIRSLPGS